MTGRRSTGLPLAVLAGLSALLGGTASVAVAAAVAHSVGASGRAVVSGLAAGLAVAVAAAAVHAAWTSRLARTLRRLRRDALRRLADPLAAGWAETPGRLSLRAGVEVAELARTLDALFVRVRVADEVAEQHRLVAETASAGMSELLSGLVAAEEGARGQLSAELHDTVAQTLMLARSLLTDQVSDDVATHVRDLVNDAEEQVRAVMARARPPALREGDLARAVSGLCDDLFLRYGLSVDVSWPGEATPLPLAVAVTVYRFFQEALLNVVKHADVDRADARLEVADNEVVASVHDDGPGFDPDRVTSERGRHVGLGLLRERARLAGGRVDVQSWPSRGTTLTLTLPLATAARAVPAPRRVPAQA